VNFLKILATHKRVRRGIEGGFVIAFFLFVITPALALNTGTEFALSATVLCADGTLTYESGDNYFQVATFPTQTSFQAGNGIDEFTDVLGPCDNETAVIVYNYSDQTVSGYVDGVLAGTSIINIDNLDIPHNTGADRNITDLVEYDHALTAGEIAALMPSTPEETGEITASDALDQIAAPALNTTKYMISTWASKFFPYALVITIILDFAGLFVILIMRHPK